MFEADDLNLLSLCAKSNATFADELARVAATPRARAEQNCQACTNDRAGERTCTTKDGCPYSTDALISVAGAQQRLLRRLAASYLVQHDQLIELRRQLSASNARETQLGLDI